VTGPRLDIYLTPDDAARSLRSHARLGLSSDPKWLPPKWFYDARSSELFEHITRLPEYYPTAAEREILQSHAADIADRTGAHKLVELGSGSSEKTRLLHVAGPRARPFRFVRPRVDSPSRTQPDESPGPSDSSDRGQTVRAVRSRTNPRGDRPT